MNLLEKINSKMNIVEYGRAGSNTSADLTVTSGRKYIDIDAYASMIAYRELLKAKHKKDIITASTTATLNQSIPPVFLDLKYHLDLAESSKDTKYIIVDTSNPKFFDERVTTKNLIEIIDHHTGFENYWKDYQNIKTQIEFIGSVCTMVYERIISSGCSEILDTDLCKLLAAGILDNTLNLKSSITTDRDRKAYSGLMEIGKLSNDFYIEYFTACETEILKDFAKAIKDDIKIEKVGILPEVIGQMIVLDIKNFNTKKMKEVFAEYPEWLMNVISLEDGKSYLYFNGKGVQKRLEELFDKQCSMDGLLILDNFLLRKQIMRKAQN
ncbi:DHH family phosphoesterase [Candidatus Saccharibacteria bacterium]|nr:DHH family phosphoesterase [Candidatus Saccharibacteria bacterium]